MALSPCLGRSPRRAPRATGTAFLTASPSLGTGKQQQGCTNLSIPRPHPAQSTSPQPLSYFPGQGHGSRAISPLQRHQHRALTFSPSQPKPPGGCRWPQEASAHLVAAEELKAVWMKTATIIFRKSSSAFYFPSLEVIGEPASGVLLLKPRGSREQPSAPGAAQGPEVPVLRSAAQLKQIRFQCKQIIQERQSPGSVCPAFGMPPYSAC